MPDVLPFKAIPVDSDKARLAEMQPGDTLGIAQGGTGQDNASDALSALGGLPLSSFQNHQAQSNPHIVTPAQIGALAAGLLGSNGGVCELDADGIVPSWRIPASVRPKYEIVSDESERLALPGMQGGDEALQLDDQSEWIIDKFGVWHPRTHPQPIFGQHPHYVESLAVSTAAVPESNPDTKLNMTTGNVPLGTYLVLLTYGWNYLHTGSNFNAQLYLNGNSLGARHSQEPKDVGNDWAGTGTDSRHYLTRFYILPNISGVQEFALDYWSQYTDYNASIWDARLLFFRFL